MKKMIVNGAEKPKRCMDCFFNEFEICFLLLESVEDGQKLLPGCPIEEADDD